MTAILFLLAGAVINALVMLWVERCSPQGYEDERGFHFGDEPRAIR